MTQIEKHEKAIRILEAIIKLEYRIKSNTFYLKYDRKWYLYRIEKNTAIKTRLENYYNKNFKL